MHRIAIVGSSGAGKSTLANEISDRLGVTLIELDALMHGPNWTPTPTPEFRAKVVAAIAETGDGGWVTPGNYRSVADIVQRRADTIVWLDLPRRVVMARLSRRSLRRVVTRERVWGGNRETLGNLLSRSPERNVVLWAWQHHDDYRTVYDTYAAGDFWAGADVHRLRTSAEVAAFVGSLPTSG